MPVTLTAPGAGSVVAEETAAPTQKTPSASSSSSTAKPSRRAAARLSSSVSMSVMVCAVRGHQPDLGRTCAGPVLVHGGEDGLARRHALGSSRWPSG